MDEKTIASHLTDCDNDLDAAIKRLNELSLATGLREAAERQGCPEPPAQDDASTHELKVWSVAIYEDIAAAADINDAHQRAFRFLERIKAHIEACQRRRDEASIEDVLKENSLLKRAVTIQHSRMKDAAEKDQQIQHLQTLLAEHQERVRALEMSNYSLSLHLKQATNSHVVDSRPPDIF